MEMKDVVSWEWGEIHDLKILPEYFDAVLDGMKHFELRKDDRDYKVGDNICLHEYDGEHLTGRSLLRNIKYILRDCPQYGLKKGYCILGW